MQGCAVISLEFRVWGLGCDSRALGFRAWLGCAPVHSALGTRIHEATTT